ncbi:hypothetical protein KIN20_012686 [Parelaphostrongylus tenuis]|uniref:Protein kinase domain-containing protein n=1 Tax=Parelaphostrongylus tenuis TaxID=148309 RepID=A0AAD5MEI7_PARTN|nr:hypothetical protein KIN20_012686 [Parelaphostrongylus tenuis]
MELVGKSLADLEASRPNKVFTVPTSVGAGIQCLEACEDLHKHGFIHRDLKPANYACDLGDKKRVDYYGNLKMRRMTLKVKEQVRTEKEHVPTLSLPQNCKARMSELRDAALGGVPCKEELSKMLDYIDCSKYHDHVDYAFIYKLSEQEAKSAGGDIKDPYDWEKNRRTYCYRNRKGAVNAEP